MPGRPDTQPPSTSEPYSPQLRTALVLTGTGTAGAYHAGALRPLAEAGGKIDLAPGRGIGGVGPMFHAIGGASRLWDDKGFWRSAAIAGLYQWRRIPKVMVVALAVAAAVVAIPIVGVALGLL